MTSNCSFEAVDELMKYLELGIYIPIFIVGLVSNVGALVVFCCILPKWTETTIYMTSLALMDLLLLFPLPFKMHAANNLWPAHLQTLCSILEGLYFFGIYGSIYTIMSITVDRWLAICHPYKAKQQRSCRNALGITVAVWALVLIVISTTISSFRKAGHTEFHCFHSFSTQGWRPVVIICLQVFGFLVPALVVAYCSARTIWALQHSGQHSPQSRAYIKYIYSSLCAFLLPLTPSHLAIFLQFLVHQGVIVDCGSKAQISLFLQLALCLSNVTCCLDALCYYFITLEVRSTKQTFRLSTVSHRRPTCSTSEL
ncbi:G-protein coupled receptor 55 [Eucyclogobius newberryi]|uniref:G-protein coupled receptor 55 n=1 Tax=Eucyclogobius newberryi TaxID=166745 RepID=UPI003B59179B